MDRSKVKIIIHGSCITRDIFRLYPTGFDIVEYFARFCISSTVSKPWPAREEEFSTLTSAFQRRMLLNDFNKTLFDTLQKHDFDYFLIDFIDERFNLIQSQAAVITKSSELMNSKYLEATDKKFIEIRRLDYSLEKWKQDCAEYVQRLTQIIPQEKIIINGLWAEQYKDASGEIKDLDMIKNFRRAHIQRMNTLLIDYYTYLAHLLPQAACISFPAAVADENHEWGLSPFHYVSSSYAEVHRNLCDLLSIQGV